MSNITTQELKDVEFHSAVVTGWINTSLEHDKSVLALSAGGIGLLITLLTTVGLSNIVLVVLYVAAILAFLVSLISILYVFRRNRVHIEQIMNHGNRAPDTLLTVLDHLAVTAFGTGAILAAVIGISTAVDSYSKKEKLMAIENKQIQTSDLLQKSFNGLGNLQSQNTGNAPPAAAPPAAAPTTPSPPAPDTTSTSGSGGK